MKATHNSSSAIRAVQAALRSLPSAVIARTPSSKTTAQPANAERDISRLKTPAELAPKIVGSVPHLELAASAIQAIRKKSTKIILSSSAPINVNPPTIRTFNSTNVSSAGKKINFSSILTS